MGGLASAEPNRLVADAPERAEASADPRVAVGTEGIQPLIQGWVSTTPSKMPEDAAVESATVGGLAAGIARLEIERANARRRLARSAYFPDLVVRLDAGTDLDGYNRRLEDDDDDEEFSSRIFLRQELLNWGATDARYRFASQRVERAERSARSTANDTAAAVRLNFGQLRQLQRIRSGYLAAAGALEELRARAQQGVDAGVESRRTVTDLDSRIAEYHARAEAADSEIDGTRSVLAGLVGGRDPVEYVTGDSTSLDTPQESASRLVRRALSSRPDILALEAEREASRSALDATRAERLPSVFVTLGMRTESSLHGAERPELRAGATSRWVPIAGGAHQARLDLAMADVRQAEFKLLHTRRAVRAAVTGCVEELRAAAAAADRSREAHVQAEDHRRLTAETFAAGQGQLGELLSVHDQVVRTHTRLADAQAQHDSAVVRLHRELGTCARNPELTVGELALD